MKQLRNHFLVGAILVAVWSATGCGNGGTVSSGGGSSPGFVDLAIGDSFTGTNLDVQVFFNVLGSIDGTTQAPAPDLILDNNGANFPVIASLALHDEGTGGGSLFVGDLSVGIAVFRDYRNLTDTDPPDFFLSPGTALIGGAAEMIVTDTDLIVADTSASNVKIFRDQANITADGVPDVILGAASEVVAPNDIFFLEGGFANGAPVADRLFVQNNGPAPTNGSCVSIFDDVEALTSTSTPDVELDITDSFLGMACPFQITVGNNTLFTSNGVSGGPGNAMIFAFNDADALTDFALPSAILLDDASGLEFPSGMVVEPTSDTLYVMNLNLSSSGANGVPALKGFSPASALVDNQFPNVVIDNTTSGLLGGGVTGFPFPRLDVQLEGGALFVRGSNSSTFTPDGIVVFADAANLTSLSTPALVFPASLLPQSEGDLQHASAFAVVNSQGIN